jgi:hypothetical protein
VESADRLDLSGEHETSHSGPLPAGFGGVMVIEGGRGHGIEQAIASI